MGRGHFKGERGPEVRRVPHSWGVALQADGTGGEAEELNLETPIHLAAPAADYLTQKCSSLIRSNGGLQTRKWKRTEGERQLRGDTFYFVWAHTVLICFQYDVVTLIKP